MNPVWHAFFPFLLVLIAFIGWLSPAKKPELSGVSRRSVWRFRTEVYQEESNGLYVCIIAQVDENGKVTQEPGSSLPNTWKGYGLFPELARDNAFEIFTTARFAKLTPTEETTPHDIFAQKPD